LRGTITRPMLVKALNVIKIRYGLTSIEPYLQSGTWWVRLTINPKDEVDTGKTAKEDISLLQGPRASFRSMATKINSLWKKGTTQKTLKADPAQAADLTAEKTAIDGALDEENVPESEYLKLKEGKPASLTPTELKERYDALNVRAKELFEKLTILAISPAERDKASDQLRKQITSARDQATKIMATPEVITILALPLYGGLKETLEKGIADVQALIDADTGDHPKTLEALRKDLKVADVLRQSAQRADNLANIGKAIKPWIQSIDDIILNTTKAGREEADVGDGNTEDAALAEARTGVQTKGAWHGPKCEMESAGLTKAINALDQLRKQTSDPAILAQIDDAVTRAKERQQGLNAGKQAWKASSFHHLAPLSGDDD
jgi:hypothetical protein